MNTLTITDIQAAIKSSAKMNGVAVSNSFGNINLTFPTMQDATVSQTSENSGSVILGELISDKKRTVNFEKLSTVHLQTIVTQLIERKTSHTSGLFTITSEDNKSLFLSAFMMLIESKRGLAISAKVTDYPTANSNLLNFKIFHEVLPVLLDNEPLESAAIVRSGASAPASLTLTSEQLSAVGLKNIKNIATTDSGALLATTYNHAGYKACYKVTFVGAMSDKFKAAIMATSHCHGLSEDKLSRLVAYMSAETLVDDSIEL